MKVLLSIIIYILSVVPVLALDIKINSSNVLVDKIPIPITDTAAQATPLSGQTTSDVTIKYACQGQQMAVLTGVTLTEKNPTDKTGIYDVASTLALSNCTPPNILIIEGGGTDRDIPPTAVNLVADHLSFTSGNANAIVQNYAGIDYSPIGTIQHPLINLVDFATDALRALGVIKIFTTHATLSTTLVVVCASSQCTETDSRAYQYAEIGCAVPGYNQWRQIVQFDTTNGGTFYLENRALPAEPDNTTCMIRTTSP